MAVTLREVALRAGVSPSAVSRAFTPGASVSAKTRARVEQAAGELGYRPSVLASALSTGRTKLIGLVSANFHNPVFLEVFGRFTRGLQDRALRPLLVNLSGHMPLASAVSLLRQYSVDGVILASSTLPADFPLAFKAAGLPVVHCFGRYQPQPQVHLVGDDTRACGRMAAESLRIGVPESASRRRAVAKACCTDVPQARSSPAWWISSRITRPSVTMPRRASVAAPVATCW